VQNFKQVFSFLEDVNCFILHCWGLVIEISLCVKVHLLQDLFLTVYVLFGTFFVYVTFKVVFMVRLPRFRTQITETFSTYTSHIVTASTSFYCFLAPRTQFCVNWHPFGISFFFHYIFYPLLFFLATTRTMIIALTSEAKWFAACASNSLNIKIQNFNTVIAIDSCTKLITFMDGWEHFA